MNIGNIIKAKRERLNMTQKELADAISMPKYGDRTIRRWENNETTPSNSELDLILNFPEEIPFPNNFNAKYSAIDLFAGIGGTRLAFHQTNRVNFTFSSEIDKFAQKTYKANFGEKPFGDITLIPSSKIPDHDILIGGFPCQAFSQAGKKLGFDDTRGTLFFEIARIIKEKKPKAFLLENVKNLKSHNKGKTYKTIEKTLTDLNYSVYCTLFKAKDFGVPQNRERIYIVGFNKDKVPNYKDFFFPLPNYTTTSVGDILENNVNIKYTISDLLWQGHQRRKQEHKIKGNGFGYSLFNKSSTYTNTLSARYYKDGSEILIEQKDKNPRKLTPRESARLQGFPDKFIIPVSDTQAYKQFGNSVAVPVVQAIANSILNVLDRTNIHNGRLRLFEAFAGYGSQRKALDNCNIPYESVGISEVDGDAVLSYAAIHCNLLDNIKNNDIKLTQQEMTKYLESINVPLDYKYFKNIANNLKGKKLINMYMANILAKNFGDISKIDPDSLPDFDLFTYSFPCQDISVAGYQRGLNSSSGTRSSLLWECCKIIEKKRPKYLMMENVKNLIGCNHKKNFDAFLKYLETLGYKNYWKVLNARNYGIPQNRERIFCISTLNDKEFSFPNEIPLTLKIDDLLDKNIDEKYILKKSQGTKSPIVQDWIYCLDSNYWKGTSLSDFITKKRRQLVSVVPPVNGLYPARRLTPLETWRFMGMSENDFNKASSLICNTSLYRQSGNSIVVNILEHIFNQLFKK